MPRALPAAFPYLPGQSGYNKRLRHALPLIERLIRALARDTDLWADRPADAVARVVPAGATPHRA